MSCPSCNETTTLHKNLARLSYCFFSANCGLFCKKASFMAFPTLYKSMCSDFKLARVTGITNFTQFGKRDHLGLA